MNTPIEGVGSAKVGTTSNVLRLLALVALFALAPSPTHAQCCQDINDHAVARCAGGCTVYVTIFWNDCTLGSNCYKNQGDTIACPSPCDGEYVYTATLAGDCVTGGLHNICEWWIRYVPTMEKDHQAKLYALDCDGNLQLLLANDPIAKGRRNGNARSRPRGAL